MKNNLIEDKRCKLIMSCVKLMTKLGSKKIKLKINSELSFELTDLGPAFEIKNIKKVFQKNIAEILDLTDDQFIEISFSILVILSRFVEVEINTKKDIYYLRYENGIPLNNIEKKGKSKNIGNSVSFELNEEFFIEDKLEISNLIKNELKKDKNYSIEII